MQRRFGLAVVMAMMMFAVMACSSEESNRIPTANGGTGTVTSQPNGSLSEEERQERDRKFTQCMRDQGIEIQDPESGPDGGPTIGGGRQGATDQKTKDALEACRQYMPDGGELPKPDPQQVEKLRDYAECMREHGVPEFPDPDAGGGLDIGGSGIDPGSQEFKAAEEACKDLRPEGGGSAGAGR